MFLESGLVEEIRGEKNNTVQLLPTDRARQFLDEHAGLQTEILDQSRA